MEILPENSLHFSVLSLHCFSKGSNGIYGNLTKNHDSLKISMKRGIQSFLFINAKISNKKSSFLISDIEQLQDFCLFKLFVLGIILWGGYEILNFRN